MIRLIDAIRFESIEVFKDLLASAKDINARFDFDETTLLHKAAGHGNVEACQILINLGLDIEARDDAGHTPLFYASAFGINPCFTLLLNGSDVHARSTDLSTAAHWAAHSENIDVLFALIDHGADIHALDIQGMTPLMWPSNDATFHAATSYITRKAAIDAIDAIKA